MKRKKTNVFFFLCIFLSLQVESMSLKREATVLEFFRKNCSSKKKKKDAKRKKHDGIIYILEQRIRCVEHVFTCSGVQTAHSSFKYLHTSTSKEINQC